MPELTLVPRSREGYHLFFSGFEQDPVLFADPSLFTPYRYTPEAVDAYASKRLDQKDRVGFFICMNGKPIGDVGFKKIDPLSRCCEIEICMQKDEFKNKGYGTQAIRKALDFAFRSLETDTVKASVLLGNARSCHVFEKLGFHLVGEDSFFRYYRMDRTAWVDETIE